MIPRPRYVEFIDDGFSNHPAVALLGPRQCGKTTLAQMYGGQEEAEFFDLESAVDCRRLESPEQTLSPLTGLVVIDEIQRQPSLFETLRVLLDRRDQPARFLLLGSASPNLVKGISESLAGRVALIDLNGFDLGETGTDVFKQLWQRGGFPRSFLAPNEAASVQWRQNFIRTFLERDIPQLGINIPAETLRRFWTMIAHYHGQVWNGAEFARSMGTSEPTARRYLDILVGAYMVRLLPPWFENLKKRQLKSPKLYIRDSGLLHALLELDRYQDLLGHPKLGASWEGFALEQLLALIPSQSVYYWATHSGAELDFMLTVRGKRHGFEFKFADAPGTTRSMHSSITDLSLHHLWVIYPGAERYSLKDNITVLPLREIPGVVDELSSWE